MAAIGKFLKWLLLMMVYVLLAILRSGPVQTWTLDDFEDGDLKSASGLSWIVIADDLGGGATEARLEVAPAATDAGSKRALRLAGRLGGGAGSFAGAWATLERTGRNLDLSAFEGVRLRVKGPARLDVGFRSGVVNFMARVEAGPDWKLVEIPFSTLKPSSRNVPDGYPLGRECAAGLRRDDAPDARPATIARRANCRSSWMTSCSTRIARTASSRSRPVRQRASPSCPSRHSPTSRRRAGSI